MKKILLLSLVVFILFSISGCSNRLLNEINNSSQTNNSSQSTLINEKSDNNIRKIAYSFLSENEKKTVINWEKAKVSRYKEKNNHQIALHSKPYQIENKDVYLVMFDNTQEAILGTINVYIDSNSYNVLGVDLRD